MNPDYHDIPTTATPTVEERVRKTGRVCRFCKGTGQMWGIRPLVWTQINETEEYQTMTPEDKLALQERFKDDIICTSCKAAERKGLITDEQKE